MLPTAFSRAIKNLSHPTILKLLLLCLLAYIVGWLGLSVLIGWGIAALTGYVGAEGWFIQTLGTFGGGLFAWFLFPLLFPVIISFFDDYMAETIERHDYPQLPPSEPPFWPTFWHDLKFTLKAVAINLLCLPLYFIPLLGIALYYGMNGYLLGSQFFFMCAGRRTTRGEAEVLHQKHRNAIVLAGVAIMFAATIPFVNLVAPVLGVATMLHFFHLVSGNDKVKVIEN